MSKKIIIIGAGPAGMLAAITAAKKGHRVSLLEKLPKIGAKLRATGGGRCNLTNTLSNEEFMGRFGREGRFMTPALNAFDHKDLQAFFKSIEVETHSLDGFRIFPVGHSALTIIHALEKEMERLKIDLHCSQRVRGLLFENNALVGVQTQEKSFYGDVVIVATGGLGYPGLGAEGDGYEFAKEAGHQIKPLHPAMMPLKTKERWGANCRADTLAKVEMRVALKKYRNLRAQGDLIFTNTGIRGPVVLDFSREITPLLEKFDEVPLVMNLTKGKNEEDLRNHFKKELQTNRAHTVLTLIETLLPASVARELCDQVGAEPHVGFSKLAGTVREALIKILAWTPLTITGHDGFKQAMITRGGVSLKEIDPNTLQSKLVKNLYFCGEVVNLDGPCGGYNLQWSFASGHLAGQLKE